MKRMICVTLCWLLLTMATGCCCDLFGCGRGYGYGYGPTAYPAQTPACAPSGF